MCWRGPATVSSLGMSGLGNSFSDRWLLVFPQRLCCSHSFGSCSGTKLEDSRAKTMGANSFRERAKLLSWVAVTTHMLYVFTRGWTWTVMLCFPLYTKAVCRLCQKYFWIGNNRRIFVSEHAVEESLWWLPLIEVNAKWLPVSTEGCGIVQGKERHNSCALTLHNWLAWTLTLSYC